MTIFLQIMLSGGWVLLALGICSAFATYIVVERVVFLKFENVLPSGVLNQVQNLDEIDRLDEEQLNVLQQASILGNMLATVYRNRLADSNYLREVTEGQGRRCAQLLSKNIDYLAVIASVSPLLGVLGTILGMIDIFGVLTSVEVIPNQQHMANGIAQALITTAYGIAVAVPCHFCHRWLSAKVQVLVTELETISLEAIAKIKYIDE